MGILFFVLCFVCALATDKKNENFRVNGTGGANSTTAWTNCISAGLCDTSGCCSGHGVCVWNSSSNIASCVCDSPQECRHSFPSSPSSDRKYSGNKCQNLPSTNDCCTSGTDDLPFSKLGGCHLIGGDPDSGAKGNLLKREGNATYPGTTNNEGSATPWSFNASNPSDAYASDINAKASEFTATALNVTYSHANLLGLGFLEFALKDIVDFEYDENSTHQVTFDNVKYPSLKWQKNTGPGFGIPKQFANNASAVIDLGPLYDWAPRASATSPYLTLQPALDHWNQTHHMPLEFLVALKYYHQYHAYAAQSFEEYYCDGRNSLNGPLSSCGSLSTSFATATPPFDRYANWQEFIFQQARRSTIRFAHGLLEVSILQILLDNTAVAGSDWGTWAGSHSVGTWDPIFEMWWRRDQQPQFGGSQGTQVYYSTATPLGTTSIRQHQEWQGDVTRASLTHHLISGLDFLLSLRPQSVNWAAGNVLANCVGVVPSALARQVVSLAHTPLQRFGSKIQANYTADLKLQLHRANELGLGSYNTHLGFLTNQPQPGTLATDIANVFYGALKEAQASPPVAARLYRGRTPSVAMASIVPINDALMADRTGYWGRLENNTWTGPLYHPEWIQTYRPSTYVYEYSYCSSCYDAFGSPNFTSAGCVINGYCGDDTDTQFYSLKSNGLTFSTPDDRGYYPALWYSQPNGYMWGAPDRGDTSYSQSRLGITNGQVLPEFLNGLFYQHDGWNSIALAKAVRTDENGYSVAYLPGQIYDSIPVNIGWSSLNYDGLCFDPQYFSPTCDRDSTQSYANNYCGSYDFGLFPNSTYGFE